MDKTYKLLEQMFDVALELRHPAEEAYCNYADALEKHERLSQENYFIYRECEEEDLADLAAFFENTLESADDYMELTRDELKDFDRKLAKIIELRGKLAEETGIPMMSHLGTKGFGRESAEFVM